MMMGRMTPVVESVNSIVMEASTSEDRKYMRNMSKDEIHQINGKLVQDLYASILEHNTYDFGDIPNSKGDIEKVKYYASTVQCLDKLEALMKENNIQEPAISEIRMAISNVKSLKSKFEYAFKTNNDYVIIMYNTTVMAIIDATSMLIAEYVNYIVGANQEKFKPTGRFDKSRGIVCLEQLKRFNTLTKNGTISEALTALESNGRRNFIGTGEGIVVAGTVVLVLLSIVPITRELIYFFYNVRLKISDYLEIQSSFLEMNELAIENSKRPAAKKKEIIRKQEKVILKLRRLSDKLKINNEDIGDVAKKQLANDNSVYDLSHIEKQITADKMNGSSIQFI